MPLILGPAGSLGLSPKHDHMNYIRTDGQDHGGDRITDIFLDKHTDRLKPSSYLKVIVPPSRLHEIPSTARLLPILND